MHIPDEVTAAEAALKIAGVDVAAFCIEAQINRATWQRWKAGTAIPNLATWNRAKQTLATMTGTSKAA